MRFAGQYYDSETGLHYNYFRYYDPKLGRYLRADPIGLAGGINPYIYTDANPINLIDPDGLLTQSHHDATGGGWNAPPPKYSPSHNMWPKLNPLYPYYEGIRAQKRHFPNDPDPYSGAYRHCVSSCLSKQRYGGTWVRKLWDYFKEDPCKKNDSKTDIEGEIRGEKVADSGQSCESGCLKYYPAYKDVR